MYFLILLTRYIQSVLNYKVNYMRYISTYGTFQIYHDGSRYFINLGNDMYPSYVYKQSYNDITHYIDEMNANADFYM